MPSSGILTHVTSASGFFIRPLAPADRPWAETFLARRWGSAQIVSRGVLHAAGRLPGFLASDGAAPCGLVTYHLQGKACEIVTLDSLVEGIGIGTALVQAVCSVARQAGCRRVWLITTNDNLPALRFYQKRGFRLAAIHRDALDRSRRLKPEIPPLEWQGIPLRDEIELEFAFEEG